MIFKVPSNPNQSDSVIFQLSSEDGMSQHGRAWWHRALWLVDRVEQRKGIFWGRMGHFAILSGVIKAR